MENKKFIKIEDMRSYVLSNIDIIKFKKIGIHEFRKPYNFHFQTINYIECRLTLIDIYKIINKYFKNNIDYN